MKANSIYFWFFVIGGFVTAMIGLVYFFSGEAHRGDAGMAFSALVQIPLGIAVTLYGLKLDGPRR